MITLKNLSFRYNKKEDILLNISTQIEEGHIYGLLGKNGTGKSTLLKLISGMLFPKSGEITTIGHTPSERKPSFLSDIYFITEEPEIASMSMKRYAKFYAPFYPKFSYAQLEEYMNEFEVSMDKNLKKMSLGQRKKAVIAFALACNTKALIMDEPTNGLDIPSKSQFRKIVSKIASPSRTIVISTHQVRDLENLIDALLVIDGHQVVVNATTLRIEERLSFGNIKEDMKPIYEEDNIRGRYGITEKREDVDTQIDIELFFNAVIHNHEIIKNLLK